jgi:inner membrane protein
VNHVAQGAAVAAVFNPAAVPLAVLGATAPDWSEAVFRLTGRRVAHRGATHYLVTWAGIMLFALFIWDWQGWLFWFGAGGALHWFGDSLTVTGVPIAPWSARRTTLFGGRLRTGGYGEFAVTGVVVIVAAFTVWMTRSHADFMPWFYDWGGLYDSGIIDGKEWRENRWHWL